MNSEHSSAPGRPPRRGLWVTLLVVALLWFGLVVGTAAGGWWFVPEGSSLAGPVMALGYGVIGALAAGVLAGALARALPVRLVRGIAITVLLLDAVSVAFGTYRVANARAGRDAAAGLDEPLPSPSDFLLTASIDEQDDRRRYREIEIDGRTWQAEWSAVGPGAARCTVRLTGAEARAVGTQLEYLESRMRDLPGPCEGQDQPVVYRLRWQRGADGLRAVTVEGGRDCLANEPAWSALSVTIGRIPIAAVADMRLRCEGP